MPRKKRKSSPGQILKAARLAAGLTQSELADQMGVEQAQVSRMEAGKGEATVKAWIRAMRSLGLRVDDLA